MIHALRRATGATALAVAGFIAASVLVVSPTALADSIYPPSGSCTSSPATVTAGGAVEFRCVADTFSANEDITITVTGENGSAAKIGVVRFAITTASGHTESGADGSVDGVEITLPSDATGIYNIAAVSATSAGGSAAVTITTADGSLSTTGLASGSLLGIWVGGAAFVLAGAALALAAFLRIRRTVR